MAFMNVFMEYMKCIECMCKISHKKYFLFSKQDLDGYVEDNDMHDEYPRDQIDADGSDLSNGTSLIF